jgi:aminoglycoside phosphotransferase (APT) family kinase protein
MIPLTPDLLTPIFAEHLGDDPIVTAVQRGPVGNGQEVWFVDVAPRSRQFVLRRTAPQGPLDWTDREREFDTLVAVAAAGLPVPHGHWSEPAGNALGDAYFVMDRLAGHPVKRVSPGVASKIATGVGQLIAKLHQAAIDTNSLGYDQPGDAAAATKAELRAWAGRYRDDRPMQLPLLGVLLAHLKKTAPGQSERSVLLWGDAGPHNVLHESGTVTGMLDWELSHVGDPHEDLGSLAWSYDGSQMFKVALDAYQTESGRSMDRDRIRYFEAMACATRSIMLLNALSRYISGATDAPNLAGLGLQLIPANLERAGLLLGWKMAGAPNLIARDADPDRIRPDGPEMLAGTIRFLHDRVLPATADQTLRRGLRTTEALLATAALRMTVEPDVNDQRRRAKDSLLEDLAAAGVDTSSGLETAAILVETDPALASMRSTVHSYLMADTAAMRALVEPLNELYDV